MKKVAKITKKVDGKGVAEAVNVDTGDAGAPTDGDEDAQQTGDSKLTVLGGIYGFKAYYIIDFSS